MSKSSILLLLCLSGITLVASIACSGDVTDDPQYKAKVKELRNAEIRNTKLIKEISDLKAKIKSFESSPTALLKKAKGDLNEGKLTSAKQSLELIKTRFPDSAEAAQVAGLLKTVEEKIQIKVKQAKELEAQQKAKTEAEQKALAEKLKKGLKSIARPSKKQTKGNLTYQINKTTTGTKWIFDRYPSSYMYNSADRGEKLVSIDFSISSKIKDPVLYGLAVYTASKSGYLTKIGDMNIKFHRWSDYGTYLGNYHDDRNDFAKRKTIKFTAGIPIKEDIAKGEALFVFMSPKACLTRQTSRFSRPPVSYEGTCNTPATLSMKTIIEEKLKPLAVFNGKKIR